MSRLRPLLFLIASLASAMSNGFPSVAPLQVAQINGAGGTQISVLHADEEHVVHLGKLRVTCVVVPAAESVVSVSINGVDASQVVWGGMLWSAVIGVDRQPGKHAVPLLVVARVTDGSSSSVQVELRIDGQPMNDRDGDDIPDEYDVDADGNGQFDAAERDYFSPAGLQRRDLDVDDDDDGFSDRLENLLGLDPTDPKTSAEQVADRLSGTSAWSASLDTLRGYPASDPVATQIRAFTPTPGGTFQAPEPSLFNGTVAYTFEVPLPDGRNGLAPDVQLTYNSDGGHSVVGFGWDLMVPMVQRSFKNGVPRYTSADSFEYKGQSGTIELVASGSGGAYLPRIQQNFTRFWFDGVSWRAQSKDGRLFVFGSTSGARWEGLVNGRTETAGWFLTEVRDLDQNIVRYSYARDRGAVYPEAIEYNISGPTGTPTRHVVRFMGLKSGKLAPLVSSDDRPDPRQSFLVGFETVMAKRLAAIEVLYRTGARRTGDDLITRILLTHAASQGAQHSALTTIQITGRGGSGSLPPISFSYKPLTHEWQESGAVTLPPGVSLRFQDVDNGTRFCHVNQDGFPDLIIAPRSGPRAVFLNDTVGGWRRVPESSEPLPKSVFFSSEPYFSGYRLADINADGLTDFIHARRTPVGTAQEFWLNLDTRWTEVLKSGEWNAPSDIAFIDQDDRPTGVEIVELNGDGLPDFIRRTTGTRTQIWLHNGKNGWTATTDGRWHLPDGFELIRLDGRAGAVMFVDLNGDGLDDVVRSRQGTANQVLLNSGSSWIPSNGYAFDASISLVNLDDRDSGTRFVDLNDDGLVDIAPTGTTSPRRVLLNTGSGWRDDSVQLPARSQFVVDHNVYGVQIADVNADRMVDTFRVETSGASILIHANTTPYVLTRADNGNGGAFRFAYDVSTHQWSGSPSFESRSNPQLPFPKTIVTEATRLNQTVDVTASAARVHEYPTTYRYEGGRYDHRLREFRGFARVASEIDYRDRSVADKVRVHRSFYQDAIRHGIEAAASTYLIDESQAPRLVKRDDFDWRIASTRNSFVTEFSNGVEIDVDLFVNRLPEGVFFVYLAEERRAEYVGNLSRTNRIDHFYDAEGNETIVHHHGDADRLEDDRLAWALYKRFEGGFVRKRQEATYSRGQDGGWSLRTLRLSRYDAAGHLQNMVAPVFAEEYVGGHVEQSQYFEYGAFGNLETTTAPNGATSSTGYDGTGRFPVTLTNALGQITEQRFEESTGFLLRRALPSGVTFGYSYDEVGRVHRKYDDSGARPASFDPRDLLLEEYSYSYWPTSGVNAVTTTSSNVGGNVSQEPLSTTIINDGFGQPSGTRQSWNNGSVPTMRQKHERFNALDLRAETSLFFTTADDPARVGRVEDSYDGIGRLLSRQYRFPLNSAEDHAIQMVYEAPGVVRRRVQQTDTRWVETTSVLDVFGQAIEKTLLKTSGVEATIRSRYDSRGLLLSETTESPDGALRSSQVFAYDSIGQRYFHYSTAAGLTIYESDRSGLIRSRWNSLGQVETASYDALGRVLVRTFTSDQGTVREDYRYDCDALSLGQLCQVGSSDFSLVLGYDKRGRQNLKTVTISERASTLRLVHDHLDRLKEVTYPDGTRVTYSFARGSGAVNSILLDGAPMLEAVAFGPNDELVSLRFQTGPSIRNHYSSAIRRTETTVGTSRGDPLAHLTYGYDRMGNILSTSQSLPSASAANIYAFDALNRLERVTTSADNPSIPPVEFKFDPLANVSWRSDRGSYLYDYGTNSHLPSSIGGTRLEGDAAGRVTAFRGRTFAWDGRDRLTKMERQQVSSVFLYDHNDRLLQVRHAAETIQFVDRFAERHGANEWKNRVFLGDQEVATVVSKEGKSVVYPITDVAGSVYATFAAGNAPTEEFLYDAYGLPTFPQPRSGPAVSRRFAGHLWLADAELYLTPTRLYDPMTGLFLSPDSVSEARWPYAYARWNPLNYVDPDGLRPVPLNDELLEYEGAVVARDLRSEVPTDLERMGIIGDRGADLQTRTDHPLTAMRDLLELPTFQETRFESLKQFFKEALRRDSEYYGGEALGVQMIRANRDNIEREASAYQPQLDPDMIRAVIMKEMAHADPIERHRLLEFEYHPGSTRGLTQYSVNSNKSFHIRITEAQAMDDAQAIKAAAFTLSYESKRLVEIGYKATAEAVGTRYNWHNAPGVTRYGKDFGEYYRIKPWR